MARNISKHVERLHRYLPFSPVHEQIYEEYQRSDDALDLETCALRYLLRAAHENASLVVLTGDAGHGKTHLCRRLLQDHLGYTQAEARKLLNDSCDGRKSISHKSGDAAVTPLRIYKDFSEFSIERAVEEIVSAVDIDGELVIVCANEGRLRAVLERSPSEKCKALLERFHQSFSDGVATVDGRSHIINLNYQSVAAQNNEGIVERILHEWLSGTRWRACQSCDAADGCPIWRNRMMLFEGELGAIRRRKLDALFAATERLGVVITIREALMAIAYLLTGGLTCSDTHARLAKIALGWQPDYAFYNLLFSIPPEISRDKLARIPVLGEFRRLDPGRLADRAVDERLINEQGLFGSEQIDIVFRYGVGTKKTLVDAANGIDEVIGNPRNKKERRLEAAFICMIVSCLRRRAYFDDIDEYGSSLDRLGFAHGKSFQAVIRGDLQPTQKAALKTRLLAGLHALQGLQMIPSQTNLLLVDPAFGSATSHAAIVARKIPQKSMKLIPMRESWGVDGSVWAMPSAVDWLDRHIVLRITLSAGEVHNYCFDLMSFDCVLRAGSGSVAQEFYAHDLRKMLNFLGRLAEGGDAEDVGIPLFLAVRASPYQWTMV